MIQAGIFPGWHRLWSVIVVSAAFFGALLPPRPASASPECEFGQGKSCASSADCTSNETAKVCAGDLGKAPLCQIPCERDGKPDHSACSLGETCVAGVEPGIGGGDTYYCKASKFSMDLNLLDACVYHFLEGLSPDLSGANQCSLVNRLSQMLDQDGNRNFNILDVDLCVRAFLDETECDATKASCADGQTYCAGDDECGTGLHCDPDLHKCTRECGLIVDRESQSLTESLDRECAGRLKTCDYDTGDCVLMDLSTARCQVNQDCPTGAYCFLGTCEPRCYRSLDCPGSDWYCSADNECLPRPKEGGSKAFNPKDYSVQLARSEIALDPIQNAYEIPLLVMDLVTKAQVFDEPNAVFGYRLELTDYRKLDDKCRQDLSKLSEAERLAIQKDCTIGPDEEFITLEAPFGTIYGTGDPKVAVSINAGISKSLTPGMYQATLSAIFSNGSRSSTVIRYRHPSPSGEYNGRVSVYAEGPKNLLGTTNLGMRLYVDRDVAHQVAWDDLLVENNIALDKDFADRTTGYRVAGYLHGAASMMFNWPGALNDAENEIPVKGIFVPRTSRLRLIGVVDYEKDFCRSENGKCSTNPDELQVRNSFGRKIRRTIELIGPFNSDINRFSGVYRETYAGLAPSTFTLDGGFILTQEGQDETPLTVPRLLTSASTVSFPSAATLSASEDSVIAASCSPAVRQKFLGSSTTASSQAAAFRQYLAGFDASGGPIFEQLTRFEDMIANALSSLSGGNGALTLDDYLKGSIKFCEPGSQNCIQKEDVECGLALYRKAWLSGWIDPGALGGTGGQPTCSSNASCGSSQVCAGGQCRPACASGAAPPTADQSKCSTDATCQELSGQYACVASADAVLFCHDLPGRSLSNAPSDCPVKAAQQPALVALQDHNRFYRELVQTYGYQAGAHARDAFFTLFHAANGDALDESSAYQQKLVSLRSSLADYDAVQRVVFNGASSHMLFGWPMNYFATRGDVWLKQMHATIKDRMETLLELVDHRRRVLKSTSQQDFLFAKHVLHQEYLQQVFLMGLQRQWQKSSFAYAGHGQELMELGDQLLAKTKDTRNPLGLHPNRIYFENADLANMNWQNFRSRLAADLPVLDADVKEAIANLKGSLADQDRFKGSLLAQQQQIETTISEFCGDESNPLPTECTVPLDEKKVDAGCNGSNCAFPFTCADALCEQVAQAFNTGTDETHVACRADTEVRKIKVQGRERECVRGRVGALMQEKVSLDLQRRQIVGQVRNLIRQIDRQQQLIKTAVSTNTDLNLYLEQNFDEINAAEKQLAAADSILNAALATGEATGCSIILGLANGGDCIGRWAGLGIKLGAMALHDGVAGMIRDCMAQAQHAKEIRLLENSQDRELNGLRMTRDNLVTEVENHIASYSAVTQQLFNLNLQIEDAVFQAQGAANRNSQSIQNLVDTLTGRESGSVLVTNRKVQDANARFQKMLIEAYKMTRAFVHRFNLDNQSEAWSNRVYQIVTMKDMQDFIAFLDKVEQNYCGAAGLDCDYVNNGEVFEFSVQKQLFPGLHDIVNPSTGKVLTVGQQFHNIITSSAYLKRRARPYGLVSQIELPFAIWLNDRGEAGGAPQRYMVGPGDCNHIIRGTGASGGTVAVNVIGTRIPKSPGVRYELWRGNTDYIRSCTEKVSTYESKVNTYIVGWTPTSSLGQLDSPPSFFTQSGELFACINNQQLGNPATVDSQSSCFKFFARDRSLGAPDYQLVIPQLDRDQKWLVGDGLAENEKPIIEDIVLYFRYNDRPITGN